MSILGDWEILVLFLYFCEGPVMKLLLECAIFEIAHKISLTLCCVQVGFSVMQSGSPSLVARLSYSPGS